MILNLNGPVREMYIFTLEFIAEHSSVRVRFWIMDELGTIMGSTLTSNISKTYLCLFFRFSSLPGLCIQGLTPESVCSAIHQYLQAGDIYKALTAFVDSQVRSIFLNFHKDFYPSSETIKFQIVFISDVAIFAPKLYEK